MSTWSKSPEADLQTVTRADSGSWDPDRSEPTPGLTILYHPDLDRIGERVALTGLAGGREERLARGEPRFSPPHKAILRPLASPYLSRRAIRLRPVGDSGAVRVLCGDSSTPLEIDGEKVDAERELSASEIERGVVLLLANRVVLLLALLDPAGTEDLPTYALVGESLPMVRLRRDIRRIADLEVPVLLRGETGTGKELVARAIHEAGGRRRRPYVTVNMGAIPPSLAAAELFGAAKGAFSGAERRRAGYFTRAEGGTLFLDEIGETPPEVQVLLLRALESHEIQPVGAAAPIECDVRLLAATDADLEGAVTEGRFRAPLLHRLSSYRITLPPLRERREDIGRLLVHFLRRELAALTAVQADTELDEGAWLTAPLVARLAAGSWPGNVRQLRNLVRGLVIAGRETGRQPPLSELEDLLREIADATPVEASEGPPGPATPPGTKRSPKRYRRPEEVGDEELIAALRAHRWQLKPAAAALGLSRGSLYDKINASRRIRKAAELSREELAASFEECGGDLEAMVDRLEVSKQGIKQRMKQLGMSWR